MDQQPVPPVRHIVLLKMRQDVSPETIESIGAAFLRLRHQIPQIHEIEWGFDISPEGRQGGHTHVLMVTFQSQQDRDDYLPHSARQTFITEVLRPHLENATVVDYVARDC